MTRAAIISRLRRFARDESGTTMVEFGICFLLFLVIFFGLIDFGRMAFNYVIAEKGVQVAARVATVRPAACAGVPLVNARHPSSPTPAPNFGSQCNAGPFVCAQSTVTCLGDITNPTVSEIWGLVSNQMPAGALVNDLRFTYTSDPALGFLGGPYVPVVTVEIDDTDSSADFQFVTGLGGLVGLLGGGAGPATVAFPSMSVSLPGEDLAAGNAG